MDISQNIDGNVGDQKFVSFKGTRGNIKSSRVDGCFIIIRLTAASSNPGMEIIIFSGEELTFKQRIGHHNKVRHGETTNVPEKSGLGKMFPGSPTYIFRGKVIYSSDMQQEELYRI